MPGGARYHCQPALELSRGGAVAPGTGSSDATED